MILAPLGALAALSDMEQMYRYQEKKETGGSERKNNMKRVL